MKQWREIQKKGDRMTNSQKIKMALAYKNMSESELARQFGTSPQAFNQRMKTDKFSSADLEKIADILGAKYIAVFEFPDFDTKISGKS